MTARRFGAAAGLGLVLAVWLGPRTAQAARIPVFARQYRTGCTTCHVAAPKLNVLGEAFRLNGYRMPENAALIRREPAVPLGEEPWEELWPRAIWPGEAPGSSPFAIRVQSGVVVQRAPEDGPRVSLLMPDDVYLMAGSSLGRGVAAMLIAEWEREEGFGVRQAKVLLQDVLPVLPSRALNLSVGLQNLYLLTSGDRQIDRAGIRAFGWQSFAWSEARLRPAATGVPTESAAEFSLSESQPAVVLNGIVGGRTVYSVGIAQGTTETTADANDRKDLFYTIRHKWGGLRYDGAYDPGGRPPSGSYGQLHDRALVLEHFGYFGGEPVGGGRTSNIRAAGAAVRVLHRRSDLAGGVVWRRDDDPWATGVAAAMSSVFVRGEYQAYPWMILSAKLERFSVRSRSVVEELEPAGYAVASPGIIMLIRQNVRLVVEGDVYWRHDATRDAGRARPSRLSARLDVAY